jgi:predicted NBD/HSP70 family sugar kinase
VNAQHPSLADPRSRHGVAKALLRQAPLFREEIAHAAGLPMRVLANALDGLESEGSVERVGDKNAAGPAYRICGGAAYSVGIDLGGTKVIAAIADLTGQIRAEAAEATDVRGGEHVLAQIRNLASRLATREDIDFSRIGAVTVGMPGVIHPRTGVIRLGPNIDGLSELNVPAALGNLFDQPVRVENDVNLAVLGEVWKGHAIDSRDVGFLSLGTGVGLGLVINGKLVRGARGAAGEVAYLPIGRDLTSASTLDVGAFELEIGSAGILARYEACGGAAAKTVRDMFSLLEAGDGVAAAIVDEIAYKAALAIVALQATLDLDKVILGGSIGVRPELVQRVQAVMPRLFSRPVDIAASALGNRAGLIGAVASATQHLHQRCFAIEDLPDANLFPNSNLAGAVA